MIEKKNYYQNFLFPSCFYVKCLLATELFNFFFIKYKKLLNTDKSFKREEIRKKNNVNNF